MTFSSSSENGELVISLILVCYLGTFADAMCKTDPKDFSCDPPFYDPTYRPICEKVEAGKVDDTRFCFLNRNHKSLCTTIGEKNVPSDFNPAKKTIIIIHGFSVKLNDMDFIFNLIKELLKYKNYNIIFVDWTASNGSSDLTYPQAVSNGRAVGALLACKLKYLQRYTGLRFDNCHIIGHSLGAQVAGFAGKRIKGLGRISALDAAGPFFQDGNPKVSVGPNDAKFVDALHTNGASLPLDGYGTLKTVGHIDGYPNGGRQQPGCSEKDRNQSSITGQNFNSCSHRRAVYLYAESINSRTCNFVGWLCRSWSKYRNRRCRRNPRVKLGFHATKHGGIYREEKFYLFTNASPPYCIRNYS